MAACLTLEEVLERIEGDDCGLSSNNDSDFVGDGIYGYMTEANTAVSLAAMGSEGALNAEEESDVDGDSNAASPVVPTLLLGGMDGKYAHYGHSIIDTILLYNMRQANKIYCICVHYCLMVMMLVMISWMFLHQMLVLTVKGLEVVAAGLIQTVTVSQVKVVLVEGGEDMDM